MYNRMSEITHAKSSKLSRMFQCDDVDTSLDRIPISYSS